MDELKNKFTVGKIYEVKLGPKQRGSRIKALYIEYREEKDSHVIEMISPIKWNGSVTMLSLQDDCKKKYGHGIQFIIGENQILKEVK